jgi:CRISPR-associated endonuclease/helicase Cas3
LRGCCTTFQRRLEGDITRVEHSIAGAALILALAKSPRDKAMAELIAHAIAGHHAGLPDRIGDASSLNERVLGGNLSSLDQAWRTELTFEAHDLAPAFAFKSRINGAFRLAFLGRMLFSCLVDADFKGTSGACRRTGNVWSSSSTARLRNSRVAAGEEPGLTLLQERRADKQKGFAA